MKHRPATVHGQFEIAKRLSAEQGFKIFDPSKKYFRAERQFIAASNDSRARGVFRLWITKDSLWIEFLPFFENTFHKKFLEQQLEVTIKQRKFHPAMRRCNPLHKMVTASQHNEFKLCNLNIQLP